MTFASFIESYAPAIIGSILTAIAGYLGAKLKGILEWVEVNKEKKAVAETVVKAIEQMYKDLHGEEKKQKAIDGIRQMLDAKGISIADIEIDMLIESVVSEFNNSFRSAEREEPHE